MSRSPLSAFLTGTLLLLIALPGAVMGQAGSGKKYAVVVGVSAYTQKKLFTDLPFPVNDATKLAEVLKKSEYLVTLITDGADLKPTKTTIEKEVDAVLKKARRTDFILIAFSGHGLEVEGDPYLCPRDAIPPDPDGPKEEQERDRDTLISVKEMYRKIGRSNAEAVVVLMDACRKVPQGRKPADLAKVALPQNVGVLFSCQSRKEAFEHAEIKHGVFFYCVLKALNGEARGVKNAKGQITFARLAEYVAEAVPEKAKELGLPAQLPNSLTNFGKTPVLAVVKTAAPPPTEFAHGMALVNQFRWADAERQFGEAIRKNPKHAEAYAWRGEVRAKQRRYPQAQADFQQALLLNPANTVALKGMAHLYRFGSTGTRDLTKAISHFQQAADQQDPEALFELGSTYLLGMEDMDRDSRAAVQCYRKAAELGDPAAMNVLGYSYVLGTRSLPKDYKLAFLWFRKAADLGFPLACVNISEMYQKGQGLPKDDTEAARWYRKAATIYRQKADRGDPGAMWGLALCYANGRGLEKDLATAFAWYKKAADLKMPTAIEKVAFMCKKGQGISADRAESARWYKKLLEQRRQEADYGNAISMRLLAHMYEKGEGVAADPVQCIGWLEKAAKLGDSSAMYSLAYSYRYGTGVEKDDTKAFAYYLNGAERGHFLCIESVIEWYQSGKGVSKDETQARQWFEKYKSALLKRIDAGDSNALTSLGKAYALRRGVENSQEAARWYRKAADAGSPNGMKALASAYQHGTGVSRDGAEALKWYQKAVDHGDHYALFSIGILYRNGAAGVSKNATEAFHWFSKAAAKNNANAMEILGDMCLKGEGTPLNRGEAIRWYQQAVEGGRQFAVKKLKELQKTP